MSELPTQSVEPPSGSPQNENARTDPAYPGLLQSIALTCITAVSLLLAGFLANALTIALGFEVPIGANTAAVNTVAVGLVVLWGCRRAGAPCSAVLRFGAFPPLLLAPLALLTLGSSIVLSEADNLLRSVWPVPQGILELLLGLTQESWGNFLLLVVVAPLTEELLFRGLILRGLIAQRGEWAAVLYSSLLFGLLHLNPWQLASAFFLGIVLGWLFIQTRSLVPCILCHAAFNALSFAVGSGYAESWGVSIPGYTGVPVDSVVYQPLPFDLLGLLLAIGSLAWIRAIVRSDAKRASRQLPVPAR